MTAEKYLDKTIDELLAEIDASWTRLMETMSAASESQKTGAADPQGWTVLDHMAHITAWERSVLFPLEGKRRHEALGITEEEYKQDIDTSNELIRTQTQGHAYEQVMSDAGQMHESLIAAVKSTDLDTLWKSIADVCPGDSASERSFMEILMGDTAEHYDEHRDYIGHILAA
jgi:hypothetical protein